MGPCNLTFRWLILIVYSVLLCVQSEGIDIACTDLNLDNGAVYRTTDSELVDYILIECHDGFKIQGKSLIHCEDNKMSSTDLPSCSKIVYCPFTCSLLNGDCNFNSTHNSTHLSPGDKVSFQCDGDSRLSSEEEIVCLETGEMSGTQPMCFPTGKSCEISGSAATQYFLNDTAIGTIPQGGSKQLRCKHGYFMKDQTGHTTVTCKNGVLDKDLYRLCHFVGFDVQIQYETNAPKDEVDEEDNKLVFNKDVSLTLTCLVSSKTSDGLPFPEVTWIYPSRLRDYVDYKEGDNFVHDDYNRSISQEYRILYALDPVTGTYRYLAKGTLRIYPTMEVHSGDYTCVVKLVNEKNAHTTTIKIRNGFAAAMYFLLILPVFLFIIVHCFYRKASAMNPFPTPNKLTRDMMQEVDKKGKLEELRANPAYKNANSGSGTNTQVSRGRRGAVVEII